MNAPTLAEIQAVIGTPPTIAQQRVRPHKMVWEHVLEASGQNSRKTQRPLLELSQGQFFYVQKRVCVATLEEATGNTPAFYPLTEVVDPSPAATIGNRTPHVDQLLFQFRNQGTDLEPTLLPFRTFWGTSKEPSVSVLDYLLQHNMPLELTVQNLTGAKVKVRSVFEGIIYDQR